MNKRIYLPLLILALVLAAPVAAQTGAEPWTEPVNISQSGAASEPVVVSGSAGALQVLWWDRFDGLMTAYRDDGDWSAPQTTPIADGTVAAMPTVFGGTDHAHALWRGAADAETGLRPLLHSRLALGTTTWSAPAQLAESALAWHMAAAPDGTVYVATVRPTHTDASPAGVYVRRSADGGASWGPPQALYETIYFRLLEAEDAHLSIAADDQGRAYATWDDPRLETAFLAVSAADGESWTEPQPVGAGEGARRARVLPTAAEPLLLWEASAAVAGCTLYQQRIADPGRPTPRLSEPERVLQDLRTCPRRPTVHRTPAGQPVLVTGSGSTLTLHAWDGEQWSDPRSLSVNFDDPRLERRVTLDQLATAAPLGRLAVAGLGQGGDVWVIESDIDALEWAFAPPSPWVGPEPLAQGPAPVGAPAVALDADGAVHVMWSTGPAPGAPRTGLAYSHVAAAGASPSRPVQVLRTDAAGPGDAAAPPALVVQGDQLVAFWSDGPGGTIFSSRAFVGDARFSDGWSEPEPLPMGGATASAPAALVDAHDTLTVMYAAPLNEGRGIYVVRGEGDGWSEPQVVFDAAAERWGMVDRPALAIDPAGALHAAWVRGSSAGPFPPMGIYYARSDDRGETWTEPTTIAEGAVDWPLVAAPLAGQVHVLWHEDGGWLHRTSLDHGATWAPRAQIRGFGDAAAPAGLAADGAGTLHLVAVATGNGPAHVVYTIWAPSAGADAGRWGQLETLHPGFGETALPGAAAVLDADLAHLHIAFRGQVDGEDGGRRGTIFTAARRVPDAAAAPDPGYSPPATPTPTAAPTPTPTPTPRPTVEVAAPEGGMTVVELGPVALPLTSLVGLALATAVIAAVIVLRSTGHRRR